MGKEKESSKKSPSDAGKPHSKNANTHPPSDEGRASGRIAAKLLAAAALGVGAVLSITRRRARTLKAEPELHPPGQEHGPVPVQNIAPLLAVSPQPPRRSDNDDIALRAYYLSEERRAAGLPEDSRRDWLDAERELRGETSVTEVG